MKDDVLLDHDLRTERAAPRWRNRYSTEKAISTLRNGDVEPGEFWGDGFYPSKLAAEKQAREDMARDVFYALNRGVRYIGAFLVEAP